MLKDKALENLEAGDLLLERGLLNAAASRYYYAMFQAAVFRLELAGDAPGRFQSGAVRWDHATIANNTLRLRGRREDRKLYHAVRQLRVRADYFEAPIGPADIAPLRSRVRGFVQELAS